MKKIVLLVALSFILSSCSVVMTLDNAFVTTGKSISSTSDATTKATKTSSGDKDKNWEYDE